MGLSQLSVKAWLMAMWPPYFDTSLPLSTTNLWNSALVFGARRNISLGSYLQTLKCVRTILLSEFSTLTLESHFISPVKDCMRFQVSKMMNDYYLGFNKNFVNLYKCRSQYIPYTYKYALNNYFQPFKGIPRSMSTTHSHSRVGI